MDESTTAATTDPGGRDRGRVTWPDLERALQARDGWRRVGREYHGPCPVTGAGCDCCFASEGKTGGVALGCRQCGGRLDGDSFRQHLAALAGATARDVAPHAPTAPPATPPPSDLPARLWRASEAPEQTPGAIYLVERRKAWPAGERLPAAVRWLPGAAGRAVGVRPQLPNSAAGCLVYRFGAPGEADTFAAQLEAVDAHGGRVLFGAPGKRPSVSGSHFASGRRVFHAAGDPDRGVHLVEGPIDALALAHLERLDAVNLNGAAVHGAAGRFTRRACPGRAAVTVWAQDDKASVLAAARLARELERRKRPWVIRRPAEGLTGLDWADVAHEEHAEREALRDA